MKLKKFLTGLLLLSLTFMPIAHAAQHDMAITVDDANTGATVRAAISSALQALAGLSSGATEPSTTYAYQLWADTTTGLLKIRNAANTAWVTLVTLSDPSATTSVEGIVELATNAESVALTDTARAVTPSNISAILDNIPKNVGIRTAATTNALTINGNAYISPSYSVLAGLFQDSANGSYYLDPANTGTSLYTAGIIHSTSGGFKFPDNSVQTSAANPQILHVREEQASGTAGGSSSTGINIRVLNTVVLNEISGASLASNQITLPAGTYKFFGRCPSHVGGGLKALLYNVTDSTYTLIGTSGRNGNDVGSIFEVSVIGKFTIAAQKVFELRMFVEAGKGTDGLGMSSNSGQVEVYAEAFVEKM